MVDNLVLGLTAALQLKQFMFMVLGTVIGLWVGVLPGLGGPVAMAILIPFPFSMDPLSALLMRALHADGRDAEALDHYNAARGRLVEELGVEPGSELRGVHEAILRGRLPTPRTAASPAAVDHLSTLRTSPWTAMR